VPPHAKRAWRTFGWFVLCLALLVIAVEDWISAQISSTLPNCFGGPLASRGMSSPPPLPIVRLVLTYPVVALALLVLSALLNAVGW
jgi:hypothetical protein